MIHETLKFFADELNKYLSLKLGATTEIRVVLGNVAKAQDTETGGGGSGNSDSTSIVNKAIVTLVNVEEDKVAKQQENYVKTDSGVNYKNPPLYLNMYVLISMNRTLYADNLKWLAHVMQYFQYQHVFTPVSHPNLDSRIQKLVIDLYTLNFEQINHLWSTLGGKYLPSVMYKIRQVTVDENAIITEGGYILEVDVQDRHKHPVT